MSTNRLSRAGLVALVCVACTRPPAQTEAPPPAQAPRAAAPRPQVSREARIEQALSRAPQLSREAAEMLVESSERRGGVWGDPADASLIEASRGFAQMPSADLVELGALFGEAYETLSAADRAAVESYVERVRRGDASDADEGSRVRLGQGVRALPEGRRARLQALLASAIRAGLETERRTALAQRETPRAAAVPTAIAPPQWARRATASSAHYRPADKSPPGDHDAEDARLRALGASYKGQLASLESSVRSAERSVESAQREAEKARETPLRFRPLNDPSEQRLVDAQEALRRARNALEDLYAQIRRERIPDSYVQ